jgi:hypothetical protein
MTDTPTNPKVDGYISRAKEFGPDMEKMRMIVLGTELI